MTDTTQLARNWLAHELWGRAASPASAVLPVAKAVMAVAQGKGRLSSAEHDYLLGGFALRGASVESIDALRSAKGHDDPAALLAGTPANPRMIVYFAIQIRAADGALDDAELATLVEGGARIGVDERAVRELVALHREEQALRKRRIDAVLGHDG